MKKIFLSLSFFLAAILFAGPTAYGEAEEYIQPEHAVPVICVDTAGHRGVGSLKRGNDYIQVSIRIIDKSGEQILFDEYAGVKIRGNSTSSAAKKPFNIILSKNEDILGLGSSGKWALLANAYDKTMLRNKLVYDFSADIGLEHSPKSRFVDLYFDGEYLGCYQLTETIGTGRGSVNVHAAENEFIFEFQPFEKYSCPVFLYTPVYGFCMGLDGIDYISDQQMADLTDFLNEAELALAGGNREEVERYFDVPSFIDTYIVHEYFKNIDVSCSSTRFYIKGGRIYAGPVWDFDLSCGNYSTKYYKKYTDGDYNIASPERWFARCLWWEGLFENKWFEQAFAERYRELQPWIVNLYEDNALGQNRIDTLCAAAWDCIEANYKEAQWKINKTYSRLERTPENSYEGNLAFLRDWLRQRNQWMLDNLPHAEYAAGSYSAAMATA